MRQPNAKWANDQRPIQSNENSFRTAGNAVTKRLAIVPALLGDSCALTIIVFPRVQRSTATRSDKPLIWIQDKIRLIHFMNVLKEVSAIPITR